MADNRADDDDILDLTLLIDNRYARLRLMSWRRQERLWHPRASWLSARGRSVTRYSKIWRSSASDISSSLIAISSSTETSYSALPRIGYWTGESAIAAERVRQLNPDVQPVALVGDITSDMG